MTVLEAPRARPLPVQPRPSPGSIAVELTGRDYLSPSAISTYQRCPLKYYFTYVAGLEPEFKSAALVFGSAIHTAIEAHSRAQLEGLPTPGLDDLLAAYGAAWQAEAAGEIQYSKGQTAADLNDLAARMLRAFQGAEVSKLDTSQVLGIEEELRGDIAPDVPTILGRVDLLAVEGDSLVISDFKTARSSWQQGQLWESSQQALLYTLLARPVAKALGLGEIRFRWIILTKTKAPTVSSIDFAPDERQQRRAVRVVAQIWSAIRARHFHPNPTAMNCTSCAFQTACRTWTGREEDL